MAHCPAPSYEEELRRLKSANAYKAKQDAIAQAKLGDPNALAASKAAKELKRTSIDCQAEMRTHIAVVEAKAAARLMAKNRNK
jgi:hypothetical protein